MRCKALFALLLISGCAGGDFRLWGVHHDPEFGPHNFAYFNQNRDMRTVIHGNPFKLPKSLVDKAITDSMQGRNAFGYTHYTTTPDETANPHTRFVIRFNPATGYSGERLCNSDTPAPSLPENNGRVSMIMAYCLRDDALAWVRGDMIAPDSTDNPAFREMIGHSVQTLIPFRNSFFPGGETCLSNNC